MKEATGELNMTVVIVLAVAILAAFFFTVLWPMIKTNFEHNSRCSKAICLPCPKNDPSCKFVDCYIKGNRHETFLCPFKG